MTREQLLREAENQLRLASRAADRIVNASEHAEARSRIARGYVDLARELDKQ